jgi:hypothetical protein
MLKIDDRPEYFRISAHVADATAFTLDAAYTDDTGATLAFKAIKLDYSLTSGIQRLIQPMRVYKEKPVDDDRDGLIPGIDLKQFHAETPLRDLREEIPTRFTVMRESDGQIDVRFNAYPDSATRVEYEYIPRPTDLTASPDLTPILPREFRVALMYGATYYLMLDKSDSRADAYLRMTQAKLQAMVAANRKENRQVGKEMGRLIPRTDNFGRNRRRFVTE